DSPRHVLVSARADSKTDPGQDILSLEAFARSLLGERAEAIELLKRYVAANPTHAFTKGGDISWWWRDLRHDPRFAALLRRCGVARPTQCTNLASSCTLCVHRLA